MHVRIESVQGQDPWTAEVSVLQAIKGSLPGSAVQTASHSLCGVGKFEVGKEYVFFFPRQEPNFVNHIYQPSGLTAEQVLKALSK